MKHASAISLPVALILTITAISTGAIISTYTQLSHTWDEGTHVVAGLEWLQDGRYTIQTENPPLSRIPLAIIPYLRGAHLPPPERRLGGQTFIVDTVFFRSPDYIRNVTEARVVTLVFFWACIAFTWLLAGGRSDRWTALLAAASVATLPPIVGHSGLATTDVAFVASFLLVLLALRRLLTNPSPGAAVIAGASLGFAVATKFSTLVLLPPVVAAVLFTHYLSDRTALTTMRRLSWSCIVVIPVVAAIVIWAAYRFQVGRLADLPTAFGPFGTLAASALPAFVLGWRIPAHEFVHGLLYLKAHTVAGHSATLWDVFSSRGFLLYYPVVLATKTPIPFIVIALAGLAGMARLTRVKPWPWHAGLALGALGVLAVSMTSPINLGVRHVMVIYPLVAIPAAFGLVRLAESATHRQAVLATTAAALISQIVMLIASVPNQLTYFNALAGPEPAYVSSDSDFDWGQDALYLERYFARHPVPELYVLLHGTTKVCSLNIPPVRSLPNHPVSGWIAVSERAFRVNQGVIRENPCELPGDPGRTFTAPHGWLDWLKQYRPVDQIGKTIRLYHITDVQKRSSRHDGQMGTGAISAGRN